MTSDDYRALPYPARQKYMNGEFRPRGRYSDPPVAKTRAASGSTRPVVIVRACTCGEQ